MPSNTATTKTSKAKEARDKAAAIAKEQAAAKAEARKAEQAKRTQEREAQAKARAEKQAADKAKREEEAKAKREAKAAEKQAALQAQIDSGALVVVDDVEFHRIEREQPGSMEAHALMMLESLRSSDVPQMKLDIADATPISTSMFAMLKALGYVTEFRSRTGLRGGSGAAYLWVGPDAD